MVPSNSLRCTCAAEVILLLKSSNFITHDLTRVWALLPALPSVTLHDWIPWIVQVWVLLLWHHITTWATVCLSALFEKMGGRTPFIRVQMFRIFKPTNRCIEVVSAWSDICRTVSMLECVRCYTLLYAGISQRNHTACYKHLLDLRDNLQTEVATFFDNNIRGKFPNENCESSLVKVWWKTFCFPSQPRCLWCLPS